MWISFTASLCVRPWILWRQQSLRMAAIWLSASALVAFDVAPKRPVENSARTAYWDAAWNSIVTHHMTGTVLEQNCRLSHQRSAHTQNATVFHSYVHWLGFLSHFHYDCCQGLLASRSTMSRQREAYNFACCGAKSWTVSECRILVCAFHFFNFSKIRNIL